MTDLLFDTPFWLPLAIISAGVFLFLSGNARQQTAMRWAGVGVVALAVLLVAVSYAVDTDVEKVVDRTDAIIAAIDQEDWATFEAMLDEKTSFANYVGRAQLAAGAKASTQKFGLREARILSRQVKDDQSLITVTINALTIQDMPPGPLRSTWELDWQQRGDQWLLYRITPLEIGQQKGESVNPHLPSAGNVK